MMEGTKNVFKKNWSKIVKIIEENIVLAIIVAVVIVAVFVISAYSFYFEGGVKAWWIKTFTAQKTLTAQLAGQKAIDFINSNILKGQGTVSLKETQEISGMYKIKMTFVEQNQDTDAYLTKDGRYLFPVMQGIPIDLDEKIDSGVSQITSCEEIEKTDMPVLEAFVVSQCPFGLQMQRVLAKAISQGVSANNVKVRYIGSVEDGKITSMHGDEEAQENLKQICIREEQKSKYWSYVSCYIKKGETESCLNSTGVDKSSLNTCVSDGSRGLTYAQEDFDLSTQYGISNSPTLILGNGSVDEFSFGGRTADALKTIICCAFNNEPSVCSQELSKDSVASGFSETYVSSSGSAADASCE